MTAFGAHATLSETLTFFNLVAVAIGVLYYVLMRPHGQRTRQTNADALQTSMPVISASRKAGLLEVSAQQQLEEGLENVQAEEIVALPEIKPQGAAKSRSVYLDHLKVFMTELVVLFHIVLTFSDSAFLGVKVSLEGGEKVAGSAYSIDNGFAAVFAIWFRHTNWSFFMSLFFFISGYFVPSSLDKKGRVQYLQDKFKRLGIPVLFMFFVFMPLMIWLEAEYLLDEGQFWIDNAYKNTWYSDGPCWFVLWLLNFSVIYAFCDGEPLSVPAPTVGMVFVAAFAAGISQVLPFSNFVQAPGGVHRLALHLVFFCSGIVAKRNAWLDRFATLEKATIWFVRCVAIACMGTFLIFAVDDRPSTIQGLPQPDSDIMMFFEGFNCVIMSFALLEFFQANFTSTNRLMKWASSGAYAVYLIHPAFVVFGAAAYIETLKYLGTDVSFPPDSRGSPGSKVWVIHSDNVAYIWFGFGFTALTVCLLLLWPLALCLTKVPGLRNIL
jgi:fucose 4-O-acetylase-like acetyltransferase